MVRHTKKNKTRRRQRGGFYSFSGAVGPGAPAWGRGSEVGEYTVDKLNAGAQYGRGRRRSRNKKSRARKTRRMRGGGKFGGVSASFSGTGYRGIGNYDGISTRVPGNGNDSAALGGFNDRGAHGGDFKSFGNLLPK